MSSDYRYLLTMTGKCFKCQTELVYAPNFNIGRSESCPKCSSSVRVCKNCIFFDSNKHNECSEPQSERVVDKEKSNFCDFFKLQNASASKGVNVTENTKEKTLAALDDLFK